MKMQILLKLFCIFTSSLSFLFAVDTGINNATILIGSSMPLEGSFADVGKATKAGVEAMFKEVNDAGGIEGRKLKLVIYNDGYDPISCVKNTLTLLNDDKVFALTSYVGTPTSLKAQTIWQREKVPVIGFYTGARALRVPFQKYNIHIRASYEKEIAAALDVFLNKLGFKKIGVFYQNDAFGEAVKAGTEIALAKAGLKPVVLGTHERMSPEVEKDLDKFVAAAPEAIVLVGTYASLAKFVKSAKKAGLDKTIFYTVSFVGPESFARELELDFANVLVTLVMPPYEGENHVLAKQYVKALKELDPSASPSFPGFEAYANAKVLVEGLKASGKNVTRESLIKAIENLKSDKIGLDVNYSSDDHEGLDSVFVAQIVNGQWIEVKDWGMFKH
jgi:branched-chain amino acid transport system substrate-binding protein